LIIPKHHAEFLHQVPDDYLNDMLPLVKRIALAIGGEYNVLQNNGSMAHQEVGHMHMHLIPKPNAEQGLKMEWQPLNRSEQLEADAKEIKAKVGKKASLEDIVYSLF